MSNVIEFPGKDARQWGGIEESLKIFLTSLGADEEEIIELLPRMREHWGHLGAPVTLGVPYSIPGPVTAEQEAAIEAAILSQVAAIVEHFKAAHGKLLFEFAKLEFQLLRGARGG